MCDRAQALLQGGEKLADMRPLAIGRGQRTDKFHYDAICPAGFAVKALHGIGVERGIGMIQERVRNLQSDLQLDARKRGFGGRCRPVDSRRSDTRGAHLGAAALRPTQRAFHDRILNWL